jgi:transposase InsO family protein
MAIGQAGGGDLTRLVHHSDRGVQYCCDLYVEEMQRHGILISMTEDYKPTDNGIAEHCQRCQENVNLDRNPADNHVRKRVKNCQPKSGKDTLALHHYSITVENGEPKRAK